MGFALGDRAATAGYRLVAFDSIGSTNTEALERARSGDPGNLWVVAKQQETGRGRRGRDWSTPYGNLAATLLTRPAADPAVTATLSFVAGLSLCDALGALAGRLSDGDDGTAPRFALKWPNDVLAGEAKLAGILLEAQRLQGEPAAVAVGIGVNVVAAPADTPYPSAALSALGVRVTAEALFANLSDAWVANAAIWDCGRGLGEIRERWLARAAGLGRPVAVALRSETVRGTFMTIDADCRLVIAREDGSRIAIAAGDVHFGAAATLRP